MTGSTAGKAEVCSGLSPEAWKGNATQWPSPYVGAVLGAPVAMDPGAVSAPVPGGSGGGPMLGDPISAPGVDGSGGLKWGTRLSLSGTSSSTGTTTTSVSPPGASNSLSRRGTTAPRPDSPARSSGRARCSKCSTSRRPVSADKVFAPDGNGVGRYMVAALLNARSGRTPVLDETGVRTMWNDLVNHGYYEPTAGIKWTGAEIIAYLQSTMG